MAARSNWSRRRAEELARERGLFHASVPYERRNEYITQKSAEKLHFIRETTKELRKFFKGFDARAGYTLNDLKYWHPNKVRQVEKYGEYLHHLRSQPHVRVAPRTKKQRRALQTFTGQSLPEKSKFGIRAYVVHKTHPDEQVLIDESGHIRIERKISDKVGWLRSDYYYFLPLLGWRPFTWDEVYAATAEILLFMPDGDYFIMSELHGEIDAPHPKRSLLSVIQRYMQEYAAKRFADTILGFKRISDAISPDAEYEKIYRRREQRRIKRREDWNRLRKQIHRSIKPKQRS